MLTKNIQLISSTDAEILRWKVNLKVIKRNTRTRYEICSKLTIKIPERYQSVQKWDKVFKNGLSKKFLEAVFYKFHLVLSWILCCKCAWFLASVALIQKQVNWFALQVNEPVSIIVLLSRYELISCNAMKLKTLDCSGKNLLLCLLWRYSISILETTSFFKGLIENTADVNLLKVNNRSTRTRCEIYSKLNIFHSLF